MFRVSCWCLVSFPVFLMAAQRGTNQVPGFDRDRLDAAVQRIEAEIASGKVGAAALLVARNGKIFVEKGFGRLSRADGANRCKPDSVFLVASISKPVTVTALMKLVERGLIRLDDPAQKYLPEFTGEKRDQIRVRDLLSHTSGLPDMLPENIELRKRQAPLRDFVAGAMQTPLLFEPGSRVSYQSMGILLAAEIVERVSGKPLDRFLRQEVFTPLRMTRSSMGLGKQRIEATVQCDLPSSGDLKMAATDRSWNWNSSYWRKLGVPWGGMHSTVGDIFRLLQAMLENGRGILTPELAQAMITNQNEKLDLPWGLGWKTGKSAFFPDSGDRLFGHTGATGTLCWADPDKQLVFVLFTNRPLDNDKEKFLEKIARMVSDAAAPVSN